MSWPCALLPFDKLIQDVAICRSACAVVLSLASENCKYIILLVIARGLTLLAGKIDEEV